MYFKRCKLDVMNLECRYVSICRLYVVKANNLMEKTVKFNGGKM